MSILRGIKNRRMLEQARRQPSLNYLPFSISDLLVRIHAELFPDVSHTVQVYFVAHGPLACIAHDDTSAAIYMHQLLNHPETPLEVITLILKHELLHLRIPPIFEKGKELQHPPAFWVAERELAAERLAAWAWIWVNLDVCLKRRKAAERIDVLKSWRYVWNLPKCDIATCVEWTTRRNQPAEADGW